MKNHYAPEGEKFCIHCGVVMPGGGKTCIEQPEAVSVLRPAPARRVLAAEDADAISARIAELRRLRDEVLNASPPIEDATPLARDDGCCG